MKQSVKTKLSKYISYLLRHHPEKAGLSLDEEGFIGLDELVKAILSNPRWNWIERDHIIEIVKEDKKGRFQIVEKGLSIHLCKFYYSLSSNKITIWL